MYSSGQIELQFYHLHSVPVLGLR